MWLIISTRVTSSENITKLKKIDNLLRCLGHRIVKSVLELFRSLELNVQHCWQLLVWLDPAIYGGVKGKSDTEKGNEGWFLFSFYFVDKEVYNFRINCIFSLF
jgi:hypothetical protein